MSQSVKFITGILSMLMFLPIINRLIDPTKTQYFTQMMLSDLPFTTIAYWMVITCEVMIGIALALLVILAKDLSFALRENIFNISHTIILGMMVLALYIHIDPAVPAESLPFSKTPYMPLAYLLVVLTNMFLNKKSRLAWN